MVSQVSSGVACAIVVHLLLRRLVVVVESLDSRDMLFDGWHRISYRKGIEILARKTKEADLDITAPSIGGGEPHLSGVWKVFEGYEVREPGEGLPYVEATGKVKKTYRPLVDTPHLFLE